MALYFGCSESRSRSSFFSTCSTFSSADDGEDFVGDGLFAVSPIRHLLVRNRPAGRTLIVVCFGLTVLGSLQPSGVM